MDDLATKGPTAALCIWCETAPARSEELHCSDRCALASIFAAGFGHGMRCGEATAADMERMHPEWPAEVVEAFCAGSVDGARRDCWRLDLLRAREVRS